MIEPLRHARHAPPPVLVAPRSSRDTTEVLDDFPPLKRWSCIVTPPGRGEPILFTLVACLRLSWHASPESADPAWGSINFGPVRIAFRFDW